MQNNLYSFKRRLRGICSTLLVHASDVYGLRCSYHVYGVLRAFCPGSFKNNIVLMTSRPEVFFLFLGGGVQGGSHDDLRRSLFLHTASIVYLLQKKQTNYLFRSIVTFLN